MAKVSGVDSLRRKLKALPDVVRQDISPVMEQSAQEVVDLAKKLVPVDKGELRDSIAWTWGDAPKGALVLGTVRRTKTANLFITIYAGNDQAFYARWVEFGTDPHTNGGLFPGTKHPGTNAKPFFFPAYRAVRRRVKGRVTRAINKAARKVAAS